MNINLGSIQIPINAATKAFAILAKRGAGKTYTGAVMAEEFYKVGIPFVVFDPIDVWWGLRLSANGKDKGLPIVVFGAEHADIPLTRDMGREIARAVVRENISCVISTFGIPGGKTAERWLISEFSEELLRVVKTPIHVFIEEAHEYVPQRVFGGLGKTFNIENIRKIVGTSSGSPIPVSSGKNDSLIESLPKYEKEIMEAIRRHPGIPFTRSQLAIKSGKSYTSSSYLAAVNRLMKLQLITKSGNDLIYQP